MLETFDKLSDNNKNSVLKEEGTSDMEEFDDLQQRWDEGGREEL